MIQKANIILEKGASPPYSDIYGIKTIRRKYNSMSKNE